MPARVDYTVATVAVFQHPDFDDHEQICFLSDAATGLRAIVAIHTTSKLGIAGGGCRMWPYASDEAALRDVLRLSKAMTYKLALADIPSGGAKSVVIADPKTDKNEALLRALGRAVHSLGGRYVIAEDVGTTPADMDIIAKETPYCAGRSGGSGDTTPPTAYGTFLALECAVKRRLGREDLAGLRVAIQGMGGVGFRLGQLLVERGAQLVVHDIKPEAVARAVEQLGATAVEADAIYDADVDVFSPCALGDVLTEENIARLRCSVIAGAANNQLPTDAQAASLTARGILYAPDFVVNMGGVLGAAKLGTATDEKMEGSLQRIVKTLDEVFAMAEAQNITTHAAAVAVAKAKIGDRSTNGAGKVAAALWRNPFVARTALRVRSAIASARARS
jgi:leucine dehydrogenase